MNYKREKNISKIDINKISKNNQSFKIKLNKFPKIQVENKRLWIKIIKSMRNLQINPGRPK